MILQLCRSKDVTNIYKYLDNMTAIDAEIKYLSYLAAEWIDWQVDLPYLAVGK
jgi:hypothetical protein